MKKEYLKRFSLIIAITIGMLFTNITPTFALTNENYEESSPFTEDIPSYDTESAVEEFSIENSDSSTEEIPVDDTNSFTEEVSVEDNDLSTEEVPAEDNGSSTEEVPVENNGSSTEEVPVEDNGSSTEEIPVEDNDSATEEILVEDNDSAIEEIPVEDNDSATEEVPIEDNDSAIEEIPIENNSSTVEEILADRNNSNSILFETPQSNIASTEPDSNFSYEETKIGNSKKSSITDNNTQAIYIQPAYIPSELFIDIEDRIKYNTRLPIDNIPSFITQEMIVGALKCQDEMNYPASVTIAQIILESGFGQYGPGGEDCLGLSYLAYEYCNLFGIKGVGTAGSVDMRTGEQTSDGEYYTINAGFRVYNTYTECIQDRTDLLKNVYSDLIYKVTDANTFATRIGSRWATSLQYSQNLISIMKRYDLYRLDKMTLKDFHSMTGKFADPCPGAYLTSEFGYRTFDNAFHKGIDLGTNNSKIPTYAADAGTVIVAGYNASAGNWIVIDHGDGLVTKYMHHSHIFVSVGDNVEKGQQIGLTGNTGNSFGIHLHFQVEENGIAVDPSNYFDLKQ